MAVDINDPVPSDNSTWLLKKILNRLKELLTATENPPPLTIGDVTLTTSDIEIGAVELKNATDDTRAVIKTSDGGAGEAGILVRAIPSATAQPVSIAGTIPVSDGGGSLTVDGAVSVSNFPATQAVSATQLPASLVSGRLDVNIGGASGALPVNDNGGSLTVDGPLTDAELRATPVPVDGPLTDAELRATPVPVSGPLTDAQLRATPVPISATQLPAALVGGRLDVNIGSGATSGTEYTEGDTDATIAGGAIMWEDTADTLRPVSSAKPLPVNIVAGAASGTEYTEGDTDATITGTAILWEDAADTLTPVSAAKPLPVSGTFFQATQPVSIAAAVPVTDNSGSLTTDTPQLPAALVGGRLDVVVGAALPAGTNNIGDVDVLSVPAPLSTAGGGAEATALRVTIADDSTGLVSVDDNGSSLTTDTPQLPAALVGGRLDVVVGAALPAGTANIGDVDVLTVPAPLSTAGGGTEATALRVTLANDSTGLVSVDDNSSSLTVDSAQLPAALVGGRLDVVVGAALPAGTNNIGDVDVLSVPAPLSTTGGGTEATALRVTVANDSTGVLSVDDNGSSLTVDGTVAISGSVAVTNAGTFAVQDSEKITDNAGFTDGTSKVQPAGYVFDETAGTALTENDAAAARIDSKRAQVLVIEDTTTRGQRLTITAANAAKVDGSAVTQPVSIAATVNVTPVPATTGGLTTFHLVSAATTNATSVKASAGQLFGWFIYNSNASARKVAFHNTSGTPTAGSSVFFSLVIPPTSGANVSLEHGIAFSSGIGITTVTGLADTDSAAVAVNDLGINLWYK